MTMAITCGGGGGQLWRLHLLSEPQERRLGEYPRLAQAVLGQRLRQSRVGVTISLRHNRTFFVRVQNQVSFRRNRKSRCEVSSRLCVGTATHFVYGQPHARLCITSRSVAAQPHISFRHSHTLRFGVASRFLVWRGRTSLLGTTSRFVLTASNFVSAFSCPTISFRHNRTFSFRYSIKFSFRRDRKPRFTT